eukprot:scaffold227199_cov24-Tisochrysis_lutea.AAC.2
MHSPDGATGLCTQRPPSRRRITVWRTGTFTLTMPWIWSCVHTRSRTTSVCSVFLRSLPESGSSEKATLPRGHDWPMSMRGRATAPTGLTARARTSESVASASSSRVSRALP